MEIVELNLPKYKVRVKNEDGKRHIFDVIRKKYLVLTPEEWVRQHFVHYLHNVKGVPLSLVSIEKEMQYNKQKKRTDIIVCGKDGEPIILVECKAPEVKIGQDTFDQIARYNMVLKVPYLIVTNGLVHYCCLIDYQKNSYTFIEDIPNYNEVKNVG